MPLMQAQDCRSPFDWNIFKKTGFHIQLVIGYRLQLQLRRQNRRFLPHLSLGQGAITPAFFSDSYTRFLPGTHARAEYSGQ